MSVSTIFILAFAAVVVVDVLIGVLRGAQFSALRFLFYVIGTVVSALLAKTVAVKILVCIFEKEICKGNSIYSNIHGLINENANADIADIFGASASGITLSAAVPFVFVGLFIAFKLITWLLYFIVKLIIRHAAKKAKKAGEQALMVEIPANAEDGSVYMTGENPDDLVIPETEDINLTQTVLSQAAEMAVAEIEEASFEIVADTEKSPDIQQPAAETIEPVAEAAEMVAEAAEPVVEEAETAVEAAEPVAEEAETATEAAETAVEAAEPVQITEEIVSTEQPELPAIVEEQQAEAVQVPEEEQTEELLPAAEEEEQTEELVPVAEEEEHLAEAQKPDVKKSFAEKFTEKGLLSRLLGGLIGLVTAIFGFAIVASPVTALMDVADENKSVQNFIEALELIDDTDFEQVFSDILSFEEAKTAGETDSKISFLGDVDGDRLISEYEAISGSIPMTVCRYTGAAAVAGCIYDSLESVNTEDTLGKDDVCRSSDKACEYRFTTALRDVFGIVPELKGAVELLQNNRLVSTQMVDRIEAIALYSIDEQNGFTYISNEDRKYLINSVLDAVNNGINDNLGDFGYNIVIEPVESVQQAREEATQAFDVVRNLVNLFENSVSQFGNLENITDLSEAFSDAEKLKDALESVINVEGAGESLKDMANDKISELTNGEIKNAVDYDALKNAMGNEKEAQEIADAASRLAAYGNRDMSTLTEEEKNGIMEDVGILEDKGIVSDDVISYFNRMVE